MVTIEPESDITISDMSLIVEGVEVETQVISAEDNLMQSQSLEDSSFKAASTNISLASSQLSGSSRTLTVQRDPLPFDQASSTSGLPMFVRGHSHNLKDVEILYSMKPQCSSLKEEANLTTAEIEA